MMGLCISKRERNRLMYSGGGEGELGSGRGGNCAARAPNEELSSYNVFFDEWGARFIESGSRRWHVIHMPGTTKFSLQEDRGNTRDLCGRAQLYSKEVYGDIAFSSYLSSAHMNLHPPSSAPPTHNLLDAESYGLSVAAQFCTEKSPQPSTLSLNMDPTLVNSTSLGASLPQRSRDSNSTSEADLKESWIPVLTVESTRHPESCQEMISIKLKKRAATSPNEAQVPSLTTNAAGEIGVFDAEKYFKAPDPQKAEHELILAGSHSHEICPVVVENIFSISSPTPDSEVQDATSLYQYRNSTAASSDVSYDSRSALSGARKFTSSDAMWSSSPCNSRINSGKKRAKPSKYRGRSSSNKGCRWSFCSRNSVVDAIDEAGFVMSASTERHSIKVQDNVKLDSLQFPPSSVYIAAPTAAKLESQQSRNSCKLLHELPQPLSPSGRLMNLLGVSEKGDPKSLDYTSTLSAPLNLQSNSLQHQGSWSSRECAGFMPSPLRVHSSRQHQQRMRSEVLQLGQDQMLGGGSSRVSQSSTGSCIEESSSNPECRADSFHQKSLATIKGSRDLSDAMLSGLSLQILAERQASITSLLPHSKANDGTSTKCVDEEKVAQEIPPPPSVPHFEMAMHSVDNDGPQRMEKNVEFSECNHSEEFLSSSKPKSVNAEEAAAAGRSGNRVDIDQEKKLEDMEHGSFNMRTMGGKNYIAQKGPECFTFPNLFCLPSSIPIVEEKEGIQHLHSSEEKQSIHDLLYKGHSSEEQGIQHLHSHFLGPSSGGTSISNNEFCQDDFLGGWRTSCSPSGASTPTSSSGGAGSAFGSPFSVAARCSSSDFRSRDELIKRLCFYSQQSREFGVPTTIQASISSTFLLNKGPSDPYVSDAIASEDHVMQAADQNLHVDAEDNTDFVNAERLICSNQQLQQLGEGCALSEDEVHDVDSDSSSDLFDLESLAGQGEGVDYSLPVFEMRSDPSCILPGSFFTVSDSSTCRGLSSSVVLLRGDKYGIVPISQLHEELDTEGEEYNCRRQSVEGMSMLMKRRLSLLS